jgi:hypothetical protein
VALLDELHAADEDLAANLHKPLCELAAIP